jgi:hypothetical protein
MIATCRGGSIDSREGLGLRLEPLSPPETAGFTAFARTVLDRGASFVTLDFFYTSVKVFRGLLFLVHSGVLFLVKM